MCLEGALANSQAFAWLGAAGVAGSHMAGHIVLTGRAKDTIVLSSGENVEPGPIEDACTASSYIQNLVLLGQDQRMLGALVVPAKEAFDELEGIKGARLHSLGLPFGHLGGSRLLSLMPAALQ